MLSPTQTINYSGKRGTHKLVTNCCYIINIQSLSTALKPFLQQNKGHSVNSMTTVTIHTSTSVFLITFGSDNDQLVLIPMGKFSFAP